VLLMLWQVVGIGEPRRPGADYEQALREVIGRKREGMRGGRRGREGPRPSCRTCSSAPTPNNQVVVRSNPKIVRSSGKDLKNVAASSTAPPKSGDTSH
jgi:hypothetical protein